MFEQIFVALVGLFGRGEARELPHRVKLAAISGRVNAACVGRLAGIAKVALFAPILGQVSWRVEAANRYPGNGGEARVAVLVQVCASGRPDRPLWRFFNRWRQCFLSPTLFGVGRMSVLKNVSDRTLGHLRLRLLNHADPSVLFR